ncbi:MAG TPA: hypothetical protein VGR00_03970, partial [Thermoanaerobaculia bacterium]|nr:hypothetical protein [Thermoanaerobaculia bacterium]
AGALAEAGLAEEGDGASPFEVVVRREVAAGGKGRLFIGGSPAPLRTLQEIAPRLLVLYGQAEARELLDPAAPRELLDRFGALGEGAEGVAALHAAYRAAEEERTRIAGAAADREKRIELLDFQIHEIDAVSPRDGEEASLAAERAKLSNVEKVGRLLSEAVTALESEDGGALAAAAQAKKAFLSLAEIDPEFEARAKDAHEVAERLADLAAATSRDLDRLEADPARLGQVAERLDALARLKRKYGATLEEVVRHREAIGKERDELADLEGSLRKAETAARAAFEAYRKVALELSSARAAAAPGFSRAVELHLRDLAFLRASFGVAVTRRMDPESPFVAGSDRVAFGPHGVDHVSFVFAPNPGESPCSLAKIASGGELSRVQLAIAAALAEQETRSEGRKPETPRRRTGPVRTFVFDEVDAGVSGATAEAVGKKLRTLASREQILVVTHLPQVAAAGERHLAVDKETAKGRTRTRVSALDAEGRVEAVASLLAGEKVSDTARKQAKELLLAHEAAPRAKKRSRGE